MTTYFFCNINKCSDNTSNNTSGKKTKTMTENTMRLCMFLLHFNLIMVTSSSLENSLASSNNGDNYPLSLPENCSKILDDFADSASNFTKCSIKYARPIRLCQKCIEHYVSFYNQFEELLNSSVNGTSCKSLLIAHDRLDAILEYYKNMLHIWSKANCIECYDWSATKPKLSNSTLKFYILFNNTIDCFEKYITPGANDSTVICKNCMQTYIELDDYYKSLSVDSIGVDSVCMDIVDSMNTTRSIWSKSFGCCKLRQTPEIIFLVCTGIISFLPLFYYLAVRYYAPIRALPNVLKQSRFKQSILRTSE